MASERRSTSIFDDLLQLQTTIPDVDPEDPEDGFKSGLTQGASEVEVLQSTQLRKQAAIIPDDPKYRGKKVSRKALHSDDEQEGNESSDDHEDSQLSDNVSFEEDADEEEGEEDDDDYGSDEEDNSEDKDLSTKEGDFGESDEERTQKDSGKRKDPIVLAPSETNDREKGKIVSYQVDLWDEIIKCRISLQKMVSACNRLPTQDVWSKFTSFSSFQKESSSTHKSVRKALSLLLELQQMLIDSAPNADKSKTDGMDEEITSESEVEDDDEGRRTKHKEGGGLVKDDEEDEFGDKDSDDNDEDNDNDDLDGSVPEEVEEMDYSENTADSSAVGNTEEKKERTKRKLSELEIRETLAERHKQFRTFRNTTLEKWDEKTRLSHAKIKSKNFASFDISVLQQIQQVLGNKDRLIKRIHQNRSFVRMLGQVEQDEQTKLQELVIEDDDDDVEMKLQKVHPELDVNYEIVDDSDFYQICLRDFIQLKQNEETDPVLANKYWLEIQNMRKKHKRKVDTRASKGRKIRYHVKEKLKNFMTPYDKSSWSDEQKDDLFKALFGGKQDEDNSESKRQQGQDQAPPTINIGL